MWAAQIRDMQSSADACLGDTRRAYLSARNVVIANPTLIEAVEKSATDRIAGLLKSDIDQIQRNYDAASRLKPFWINYPPEDRGRSPRRSGYPWIEVGEHAVGSRLQQLLVSQLGAVDLGFPGGTDQRLVAASPQLKESTQGELDFVWIMADIKSVGPTDDADHVVLGHNQVSGSGEWPSDVEGVSNRPLRASGSRASHDFFPALPPLVVLPSGSTALVLTFVVKPVYRIIGSTRNDWMGQPLSRLDVVSIPNGLLLEPMLSQRPGLLFPGKDEKSKQSTKMRARLSLSLLREVAPWRHRVVWSSP